MTALISVLATIAVVVGSFAHQLRFYQRPRSTPPGCTRLYQGRLPRGLEWITWPARRTRNRIRGAWRWRRQGRPKDVPVVIRPGRLIACPHGHGLITEWHFDLNHITTGVLDLDLLWERFSAAYPVERVDHLDDCTRCEA